MCELKENDHKEKGRRVDGRKDSVGAVVSLRPTDRRPLATH